MALTSSSPKADIEAFQLNLEFLGFPLPRFGADGSLGTETRSAAHGAAVKYSLPPPTGEVYPTELVEGVASRVASHLRSTIVLPEQFYDLTERAYPGPRESKVPWSQWKGVTIHQTGAAPIGLENWSQERIHKRWIDHSYINKKGVVVRSSLRAHIGITRDGEVLLVHPLDWFIWHGHGLSTSQWGIEIEAFARGIESDPQTLPAGGFDWLEATDLQIERARQVIQWLDAVLRINKGSGLEFINPHRTASEGRRPDPGQRIYKGVNLWAQQTLGLKEWRVTGKGFPTPEAWNPNCRGVSY